jgi:hypothetical protein
VHPCGSEASDDGWREIVIIAVLVLALPVASIQAFWAEYWAVMERPQAGACPDGRFTRCGWWSQYLSGAEGSCPAECVSGGINQDAKGP